MSLKEVRREIKKFKENISNSFIYSNYYKQIDENIVYLESRDGKDFIGNIFRISEELSSGKYGDLKLFVYATKEVKSKIKKLQSYYNLKIHKIITNENKALRILEKAKYIITDSGIRPRYVKRSEQIFIYTFHGTPFKKMGFDNISEEHTIGSVQHPILSADYLLFPNDYMKEKMLKAYLVDKLFPGKILMEGYPRNSVFFDENKRREFKSKLNLNDKEIFVYMPTFRGTYFDRLDDELNNTLTSYFRLLDKKLKDNQLFFVKLHIFNESEIDFSEFNHIKPLPKDYEIYDLLNMADVLITDYSSILFDFANTRRKIILFNYDEEEYLKYRGTYFSLSEFPFPKVQTIDELVNQLNTPKNYDDSEFLNKFCQYDNPNAVSKICNHIFNNKNCCIEESIENDKSNILIYAGSLSKNGITSSLVSVLSNLDTKNYNIYLSFAQYSDYIKDDHEEVFKSFPRDIKFLPIRSPINFTLSERRTYNKFKDSKDEKNVKYPKMIDKLFKREINRLYPGIHFDKMINFDGYGNHEILLYKNIDCENSIWVHNDMVQEYKNKHFQNWQVLKEAYNNYDNVISVSPDLEESIMEISENNVNISIVHNIGNYKDIIEKSKEDIKLDKHTYIDTSKIGGIPEVLNCPGKKFITIGRFSPEKGHKRLLLAFDEFCEDFPDTQLIIIGGYGPEYDNLLELRETLNHWENVTIIQSISNPMPILKECDLFVLSSFYEGWPMVIMEADILDIPIIATDITGTQWMNEYNGYIVGNSKKDILQGFYDFMDGKVTNLALDYEQYNKQALKEFTALLE